MSTSIGKEKDKKGNPYTIDSFQARIFKEFIYVAMITNIATRYVDMTNKISEIISDPDVIENKNLLSRYGISLDKPVEQSEESEESQQVDPSLLSEELPEEVGPSEQVQYVEPSEQKENEPAEAPPLLVPEIPGQEQSGSGFGYGGFFKKNINRRSNLLLSRYNYKKSFLK